MEVAGHGPHLVGVDQHLAALGPDDDVGLDAVLVQPLDLRIDRGRADAAPDEEVAPPAQLLGPQSDELRRTAQRPGEVGQRVADLQGADLARRDADGLRNDRYAALLRVEVGAGERTARARLVGPHDDELPGQRRSGHAGRADPHEPDALG